MRGSLKNEPTNGKIAAIISAGLWKILGGWRVPEKIPMATTAGLWKILRATAGLQKVLRPTAGLWKIPEVGP